MKESMTHIAEPAPERRDVAIQVERCIGVLDLIDNHVITSHDSFSTPFDPELEQLRDELNALAQLLGPEISRVGCRRAH